MATGPQQRVDRALLIGVDRYQYLAPQLNGCVGDVEALAKLLVGQLHTPPGQVVKLTAGHARKEKPEELATRANVVQALQRLATEARSGEQIYIHYSGHGMRNDGTVLPGYEADGRDEAIAPTDTGYRDPAAYYLLDKELGWLLRQITATSAFVTVVLDCCHSASGTRNLEQEVSVRHGRALPEDVAAGRGWEGGDPRPRPDSTLVAPLAELKKVIAAAPDSSGTLVAAPKNYVLLTACRERETAKEYQSNGLVTYYFLALLGKGIGDVTYRSVQDQVAGGIAQLASGDARYEQTPQLEGDGDLILFGGGARAEPTALVASPQADGRLLLSGGGAAVGVVVGTTVALYAPGTADLSGTAGRIGLATVTDVQAHASFARAEEGMAADRLVPGMRAAIVRPGVARVRRRVAIGQGPGLDALKSALAARDDGRGSPYVEVVGLNDLPELSVVIDGGRYLIRDAQDQPLPRITPPLPVGGATSAGQVVQRLEHVVQYRNAWELHNADPASRLSAQLAISVEREGAGARAAGRVTLHPGEIVHFHLHNHSRRPLSAALLYFAPNWSIKRIWPSGTDYTELAATGEQGFDAVRQTVQLPANVTSSLERLKLFATDQPTSFQALELGSLDTARAATRGLARNALEQLLANVGNARATRELVDVVETGDWGTAELELRTEA